MNKTVIFIVLVLVVGSLFTLAQEQQAQEQLEEQSCSFWYKVVSFLSGEGREKVVGEIT